MSPSKRAIFESGIKCAHCRYRRTERKRFVYNGVMTYTTRRVCGKRKGCPYANDGGGESER